MSARYSICTRFFPPNQPQEAARRLHERRDRVHPMQRLARRLPSSRRSRPIQERRRYFESNPDEVDAISGTAPSAPIQGEPDHAARPPGWGSRNQKTDEKIHKKLPSEAPPSEGPPILPRADPVAILVSSPAKPSRCAGAEANHAEPEEASQSPFSVTVGQVYDGPLDLLLDLIRKQNIDIYDIPIARSQRSSSTTATS